VCVNSDPTTSDDDVLGAFPAHASAVRSEPPKNDKLRHEWTLLRAAIGDVFDDIRHADGTPLKFSNKADRQAHRKNL